MTRHHCQRLFCLALLIPACAPATPVEQLPSAESTLLQARRRIGEALSLKQQAELQGRGDLVLKALTSEERYELGRNLIRFQLDAPAYVNIAAPLGFEPFWLADQGFSLRPEQIQAGTGRFSIYQKRFEKGWVGLGVNSLDQRTPDHYAVFIDSIGPENLRPRKVIPNSLEPSLPLALAGWPDGGLAASDLPLDLFESVILPTRRSDRHASAFLTTRPWKTHTPSRNAPDQVVVSFGANASTTLAWNWRTRPEVQKTLVRLVEVGKSAHLDGEPPIRTIHGRSSTVESFGLLNDPIVRRHKAEAGGLRADTLYRYSVGDGSQTGWSEWTTVRTGPAHEQDYQLMYLGDAQCGLEGWGKLLHRAIERHRNTGAILLAGDLVDRGNERSNWDHFFLRGSGVLDRIPFLPAVGNHEYLDRGPVHYSASFTLPSNGPPGIEPGLVYACEYGDSLLLVLDSNLAKYDRGLARLQGDWLEKQVARSRATWRIVMFHHPVYASHPTRENPEIAEAWEELFDRNGIDLVLQGHDHAYLRTHPMRAGRVASSGADHATTYVVSVSGEKFVEQAPRDYAARCFTQVATYQLLDISPVRKTLTYRSFNVRGKELDRLILHRRTTDQVTGTDRVDASRR